MMPALIWTAPPHGSPPLGKPNCARGPPCRQRSFRIGEMMKKILNHRDTENTEKNATRRALFIVFSVCSVPLWLIPAFSAQPPIVGRPVDFSGAIGGPFVVTMEVEPSQVAIEEPFTL